MIQEQAPGTGIGPYTVTPNAMFTKLIAIGSNTFTEVIRQPIYGILIMVATLALVFNVAVAGFTLSDDDRLMQDMGLSTLLVTGLFLAAFGATGVVSQEIENQTVLTVISKPVGRPIFILGKFLGVAGAMVVSYYLLSLVFFLTTRHSVMERLADQYDLPVILFGCGAALIALLVGAYCNYAKGWHFGATAIFTALPLMTLSVVLVMKISPSWQLQALSTDINPLLLAAVMMTFMAVAVLAAVAVAASTRLGQVMTLVVCAGVFVLGLISSYAFGRFQEDYLLASLAYKILPEITFFWITDALTQESAVSFVHFGMVAGYCSLYVVGVLALAVALFQRREVG